MLPTCAGRSRGALVAIAVAVGLSASMLAQGTRQDGLTGAWELVGVRGVPDADQPSGILLFTPRHFAFVAKLGGAPVGAVAEMQEEQLRLAWDLFEATAGTYSNAGGAVSLRPLVARGGRAGAVQPLSLQYEVREDVLSLKRPDGSTLNLRRATGPATGLDGAWSIVRSKSGAAEELVAPPDGPAIGLFVFQAGHYANVGLRPNAAVLTDSSRASLAELKAAWANFFAQGGKVSEPAADVIGLEPTTAKQIGVIQGSKPWRIKRDGRNVTLEGERASFALRRED